MSDPGRPLGEYQADAAVTLAAQQAAAFAEAARVAEAAEAQRRAEEERVAAVLAVEASAAATAQRSAALTQATPAPTTPASTPPAAPTAVPTAPQTARAAATSDIQAAAAAAGWPADQLAKVERVAICESSGMTTAVSSAGYVGLMQVAPWLHGPVPADAVGQLAQAYVVYQRQGWGAWPVCGR